MKASGIELRRQVLEDCDGGMTERAAAEKWRVSAKWIQKIKKRRRETGSLEPATGNHGRKAKLAEYRDILRPLGETTPDATREELREQLPVRVCIQTVANELRRMKLPYKKNTYTPPSKTGLRWQNSGGTGKRR
jgi:transposase